MAQGPGTVTWAHKTSAPLDCFACFRWTKEDSYSRPVAENPEAAADTSRLEMFSDGVFAIAITLLVIEIPVPEFGHGVDAMREALAHEWPAYLSYAIGFSRSVRCG